MKTQYRQSIRFLLVMLLVVGMSPLQAQVLERDDENADYITVSGVVKDKQNKKRLEYVNISIPGSTSGTITNEEGEFSFKIKDASHVTAVEVSHIGYYNAQRGRYFRPDRLDDSLREYARRDHHPCPRTTAYRRRSGQKDPGKL